MKKSYYIIALICAVAAALIIFRLGSGNKPASKEEDKTAVVAAAKDIPAKTVITEAMVHTIKVDKSNAIAKTTAEPKDIIGKSALRDIKSKEQITEEIVGELGEENLGLSGSVPKGMRAFTLEVDIEKGLGGMLQPGDIVDVLSTSTEGGAGAQTEYILRNIQVISVDKNMKKAPGEKEMYASTTVAVKPDQAIQLEKASFLAKSGEGNIRLVVKSFLDK